MQIDQTKVDKLLKETNDLNNREKFLLMESIMRKLSFEHGNPVKARALKSYLKIAHGSNYYFKDLKES